jgi:uncharacterized protein (TIGR03437 family)
MSVAGATGGLWAMSPLSYITQPVTVTIGGYNAEVQYAGSAPLFTTGFIQINARIPQSLNPTQYQVLVKIGDNSNVGFLVKVAVQ